MDQLAIMKVQDQRLCGCEIQDQARPQHTRSKLGSVRGKLDTLLFGVGLAKRQNPSTQTYADYSAPVSGRRVGR